MTSCFTLSQDTMKNKKLKVLAIDTSATACSAAVTDGTKILCECLLDIDGTLSGQLLGGIDRIMRDAGLRIDDLDGIGVSLGPGSFTGLRVGVATAKGLSLAAGKPVTGFSSLAMLAFNLPWSSYPVCPMLDARKNEVYTALYRCKELPEAILDDCVIAPASFLDKINEPTIFVGPGAIRYRELIESRLGEEAVFAPCFCNQPRASAGAVLAHKNLLEGKTTSLPLLNPSYIRPSEAEIKKMTRSG
jgi:tRNA threonylcarbamoyladenosine biosynthesis protein TsaB